MIVYIDIVDLFGLKEDSQHSSMYWSSSIDNMFSNHSDDLSFGSCHQTLTAVGNGKIILVVEGGELCCHHVKPGEWFTW